MKLPHFPKEMNASHALPSSDGMTPLATAAGHGNVEMVRCLLLAKASVTDGEALHIATDRGHLAVVKCLLETPGSVAWPSQWTALWVRCTTTIRGYFSWMSAQKLYDGPVSPSKKELSGNSPVIRRGKTPGPPPTATSLWFFKVFDAKRSHGLWLLCFTSMCFGFAWLRSPTLKQFTLKSKE